MPFSVLVGSDLLALDSVGVRDRRCISKEHVVSIMPGVMIDESEIRTLPFHHDNHDHVIGLQRRFLKMSYMDTCKA